MTGIQELKSVGVELSRDAARLPINGHKNRNRNVLPYDHSRIKLMSSDADDGRDYINGSWMPVRHSGVEGHIALNDMDKSLTLLNINIPRNVCTHATHNVTAHVCAACTRGYVHVSK